MYDYNYKYKDVIIGKAIGDTLAWELTLYTTIIRNANPFQTYFERDLHCF